MADRFSADDSLRERAFAPSHPLRPIDLAHEPPFQLGTLEVRPPTREVIGASGREVLEPRVMQVLVALASAHGEILSRDDLIALCWEGRAVSDDAINRVLSKLRGLARTFEAFQLETIIKVGYRLVEHGGSAPAAASPSPAPPKGRTSAIDRRRLLAGGAAAAGALGAGALWWRPWRHRPAAEAVDLTRRGDLAWRLAFPDQLRQAASYYERAVQIDPLYADAWGGLALSYSHNLEGFGEAEMGSLPGRIRSAARRALELDPNNAQAQLALLSIEPYFRNWQEKETRLRRLAARHSRFWLAQGRTAIILYEVGRLSEGIEFHRKALQVDHMLPGVYFFLARSLSSLGRLQEAETLLDEARRLWPAHPLLWFGRYDYLLFGGRPRSAAAFVMDPDALPSGFGPPVVEPRLRLARAVETRDPADIEASVEEFRQSALRDAAGIPYAASVFAALGRPDLAFASLERYYFDRGSFGPSTPIGPYTRRYTHMLFAPAMAPLRSDPRFADLLRRVGLEAYWQSTGTVPDFRRPG